MRLLRDTVKLPDACGPGAGGPRRPCVRLPKSCACGSRASWLSYGDLADKYASSNSSTGTSKYSVDRREYIRSRQRHQQSREQVRPCEHETIRPSRRKTLQNGVRMCAYPGSSISLQGLKYSHARLTATQWRRFLCSYPNLWDNSVDTMLMPANVGFTFLGYSAMMRGR